MKSTNEAQDQKITPQNGETINQYRKIPVVIEAFKTETELSIETLEGTFRADPGDYIITGVNGEQYPCKPDIFEKSYEAA